MKKEFLEWLKSFAVALLIVFLFKMFFGTTVVYSTSMYPTLIEKDVLLLQKTQSVERGDIVSFKSKLTLTDEDIRSLNVVQKLFVSKDTQKTLIKRVIGVPGDSIEVKDGIVKINGEIVNEPYVSSENAGEVHILAIPEGQYFMMGDNRAVSLDSRSDLVGLIEEKDLVGKVLVRLWPVPKIGSVE